MTLQLVTLGMAIAEADLGVREDGGENRGPRVSRYLASTDPPINVAAPWCAAWVQYLSDRAAHHLDVANPLDEVRREALVADYVSWAAGKNRLASIDTMRPGDLIAFNFRGQRWDHIGIVVRRLQGNMVSTVEANTSPGVGATNLERERDGDGVFTKVRNLVRQPVAIIRWGEA